MTNSNSSKSFFEYLGLADVERIHSQFLAWVLSTNCNALDQKERDHLLLDLFGISGPITSIQTERNRIDILIETPTDVIVIENKMKSSQHSNQLAIYEAYVNETYPNHSPHYFFLTLVNEKTSKQIWKRLTYSLLFKKLSSLKIISGTNHSVILAEYLLFLQRLDEVVTDFHSHVQQYDMVFLDRKKKKHEKIESDYKTENEWFIASNQLETILQKSFLIALVDEVKNPVGRISETRGDALVDFKIESDLQFEGRLYSTALQLQGETIKFTFAIQSSDYLTSKKQWIENIIPLFKQLIQENSYGYKKLNKPKNLAYLSISKKLDKYYWQRTLPELAGFIQEQMQHCKEMTKYVKEKIHHG